MHAGNRCRQTLICKPQETVNQHTQFFRLDEQGGANARHSQLAPALHSSSRGPGDVCARTFLWKRENSDSEGDAPKVEIQKWKHSIHTHFRKDWKRSIPRTEEIGDLKHSWAQKCRGISPFSGYYPWETIKVTGDTEKNFTEVFRASQKRKANHMNDLLEFGKSFEESSWNHRATTNYRSETNGIAERAVRRVKRRDISRIIALWIGW